MIRDKFQSDFSYKYYLSTEGYYFKYRKDKYDSSKIRADLYDEKTDNILKDIRVSAGYGLNHRSHHDVINAFEVFINHPHLFHG